VKEVDDFFCDQLAIFPFSIQISSKIVNFVFLAKMLNFATVPVDCPKTILFSPYR